MNPAQKHLLKTWVAAILWLGLIAGESSNLASAENTSRILYAPLHFLFGVDPAHFPIWHFLIRKTGHFVGYFTLSWLLFRAWHRGIREVDLIMGGFADAHLAALSEAEVDDFERLMEVQEHDLLAWVTGGAATPADYDTGLFRRLSAFNRGAA